MKILLINTLYYPYKVGGAEISVKLLAEELVKFGNEVIIISIHEKKIEERNVINGVKTISLSYSNIFWQFEKKKHGNLSKMVWHLLDNYNFIMKQKIRNIIKEIQPEVIHTNNLSGISVAVWDIAKEYNCRVVHTSRDYYLLHPNCKMHKNGMDMSDNAISVKIWSFLKKQKSKKVDVYVGISNYIKNRHLNAGFFKNAKSVTIYNAVANDCEVDIPSDFGINSINNIGFIGRLTKEKGFDIFCDLARENKDKKFIAAGEFENDDEGLKDLALKSGIELLGHYPVEKFMKKIELLVLPIRWQEPFGRVVIEGVVAGKSILTNKVGGITELAKILPGIYFIEDVAKLDDVPKYKKTASHILEFDKFTSRAVANEYLKTYKGIFHE